MIICLFTDIYIYIYMVWRSISDDLDFKQHSIRFSLSVCSSSGRAVSISKGSNLHLQGPRDSRVLMKS